MKTITLHFHDVAAKHCFILCNRIGASEIMAESPASLTLEDSGEPWENSVYVHSITKENKSTGDEFDGDAIDLNGTLVTLR